MYTVCPAERKALERTAKNSGMLPAGATAPLEEAPLRDLLGRAREYEELMVRIALRRLDGGLIDAAVSSGALREQELSDEAGLRERVAEAIDSELRVLQPEASPASWSVEPDPEHDAFRLVAERRLVGLLFRTSLDTDFLRSADFQRLSELASRMREIGSPLFRVLRDSQGEPLEVPSATVLLDKIIEHGQKGLSIQRYKGLGEMNPDQLAETTMDPGTRTLLQVRIEDKDEADFAFTTLMGDDVEPRREFIERNALDVQNLDI